MTRTSAGENRRARSTPRPSEQTTHQHLAHHRPPLLHTTSHPQSHRWRRQQLDNAGMEGREPHSGRTIASPRRPSGGKNDPSNRRAPRKQGRSIPKFSATGPEAGPPRRRKNQGTKAPTAGRRLRVDNHARSTNHQHHSQPLAAERKIADQDGKAGAPYYSMAAPPPTSNQRRRRTYSYYLHHQSRGPRSPHHPATRTVAGR